MLYATALDNGTAAVPPLVSTGRGEAEVIFGGEGVLARTIRSVAASGPSSIFVLYACVVETIGDDVSSVCRQDYGVPVTVVPTAGFLGGTFQDGVNKALLALADHAEPCPEREGAAIIGEMNL